MFKFILGFNENASGFNDAFDGSSSMRSENEPLIRLDRVGSVRSRAGVDCYDLKVALKEKASAEADLVWFDQASLPPSLD
jgi:hypothetical protein